MPHYVAFYSSSRVPFAASKGRFSFLSLNARLFRLLYLFIYGRTLEINSKEMRHINTNKSLLRHSNDSRVNWHLHHMEW